MNLRKDHYRFAAPRPPVGAWATPAVSGCRGGLVGGLRPLTFSPEAGAGVLAGARPAHTNPSPGLPQSDASGPHPATQACVFRAPFRGLTDGRGSARGG